MLYQLEHPLPSVECVVSHASWSRGRLLHQHLPTTGMGVNPRNIRHVRPTGPRKPAISTFERKPWRGCRCDMQGQRTGRMHEVSTVDISPDMGQMLLGSGIRPLSLYSSLVAL
jgi:hypothetical protein